MTDPNNHELIHQCAWCGHLIYEDEEYFGFGAKASQNIDLNEKAGEFVSLNLSLQEKTVFALIPDKSGTGALAGHDLIFITCSEDCALNLKEALDLERDVYHNVGN
jgi:endogenous inhibitor of DNA gyrase (YacG/DUF329 family)